MIEQIILIQFNIRKVKEMDKERKSSLKRAGIIVSLISSLLLMFLIFGAFISNEVTRYGESINTENKSADADIVIHGELTIGPNISEDYDNFLATTVLALDIASSVTIIYSSVMLLLHKKEKNMMILSSASSIVMLISISIASRNCCGIILMIFPMSCIVGNILMWIGNYNEKNMVR